MGFPFSNKFLYSSYKNVLLSNEIVLFCELNDVKSFKKFKKDLNKNGFLVTNIKSKVFKNLFNESLNFNFRGLFNGPVFVLYKNNLNFIKDINVLKSFIDYNFILCCLMNQKLYGPLFLKSFKGVKPKLNFYFKVLNDLNMSSAKLNNLVKQIHV